MLRQLRERALRTVADRGQTMAEYAVVLGIITLAVVGAIGALSGGILSKLGEVTGILGGVVL